MANVNLEEYQRECINVEKVFDYVILNSGGTANGLAFTLGVGIDIADLLALLAVPGNSIANVSVSIDTTSCNEMSSTRPNQEVELDNGEVVTLQWVTIEEGAIGLTISFDVVNVAGLVQLPVTGTATIGAGTIAPETLLMCAPVGTTVECDVLPSSTFMPFNFADDGTGLGLTFDLRYNLCQSVQSTDEVTLEVLARLCRPRDIILPEETCEPIMPQQCPMIFPGPDMNGTPE